MIMKNIILIVVSIFIYINLFAQFGGGSGTESDPYRIYTISHLEEIGDSLDNGNYLYDRHFRLMNDIVDDSLANMLGGRDIYDQHGFGGCFHGGGHTVALNIEADEEHNAALFYHIGSVDVYGIPDGRGYVDSLTVVGKLFTSGSNSSQRSGAGFCIGNRGTIYRCVSKLQVGHISGFGGIASENRGNIISCTNYTNTSFPTVGGICLMAVSSSNTVDCVNYGNFKIYGDATGGICAKVLASEHDSTYINIIGCANYGEISSGQLDASSSMRNVGGIIGECNIDARIISKCLIKNCQNYGTVHADSSIYVGGLVGGEIIGPVFIENCANYGDVIGKYNVGGIAGEYYGNDPLWVINEGYTYPTGRIINCFNSGHIQGESAVGGIAGSFASYCGDTLAHCLNIGKVEGSAICSGNYDYEGWDLGDSIFYDSNYYDAQMLADTSANEEGMYEWKFTSQLTGDTPELRAMLGDGWSYAEGRYPIPLGLEEDSLAMLFATPIYLYAESEEEYEDVDLVQHHFLVGTENEVSWASGSRLSIVGENATILASGNENVTASLAGYSFTRNLNLINPVTIAEQDFDDLRIYPNPATDILNITSSETISEIEIVNVMGQVVYRTEVNADNAVCDVEGLNAGVYIVIIYGNSRTSTMLSKRKFVKE